MERAAQNAKNPWRAMIFIGISLLVISLDNTILNVALPSISIELGATASQLQWIVDAYVLVFAALLLTMGAVSDRIGRKRALQFGLLWFGVFSLMAALSGSTTMLIVTRALLGLGGATIMPSTLSLITSMFDNPKERAQAIAIWAAIFGLGVGVGPVVGGWLLEHYEWNAVFLVNLPIVVLAVVGGQLTIEESRDEHAPRPDIPGVVLSITGLFSLVYGIIEAGQSGWTEQNVLIAFGAAAVLLTMFGIWEYRSPNAMLPLGFFRNMSFTGANLALTLVVFGLFGSVFFFSQYFQSVQGYTALEAGLRMFPQAIVLMFSAAMSARVAQVLGTKITVGVGILIAAGGLFFMSQVLDVGTSYGIILLGMIILGIGMGMAMSPATNSIMGSVPVRKAGIGSAMNDTTRQLGGALGVAVLGTIANNTYLTQITALESKLPPQIPGDLYKAVESSIQGAHIAAGMVPDPTIAQLIVNSANHAFTAGMNDGMLIGSAIMLLASLIAFAILPSEVRRSTEEEMSFGVRSDALRAPVAGD
ncbi:MFS transporter [Aggregatilinea lenta]|uniref:MFS transporter n=1 Tax=Aggregatilinea lenta TaxID=913108 RepID=UPI0013C2E444|nr:MFS transporter [Aggregatilinea lenta]